MVRITKFVLLYYYQEEASPSRTSVYDSDARLLFVPHINMGTLDQIISYDCCQSYCELLGVK